MCLNVYDCLCVYGMICFKINKKKTKIKQITKKNHVRLKSNNGSKNSSLLTNRHFKHHVFESKKRYCYFFFFLFSEERLKFCFFFFLYEIWIKKHIKTHQLRVNKFNNILCIPMKSASMIVLFLGS